MQSHPASPLTIGEKLVTRLAETALFMGLDDADEVLMWEYFAIYGEKTPNSVLNCLRTQGENRPFAIRHVFVHVSLDAKWVKPSGILRRKKPLNEMLVARTGESVNLQIDAGELKKLLENLEHESRAIAFSRWYDEIGAVTENGRVIEVSAEDITVRMDCDVQNLFDTLTELAA
jgi:hypothetical protein